jgi:hypothetical protein
MRNALVTPGTRFLAAVLAGFWFAAARPVEAIRIDAGCETYPAWPIQVNPWTDALGVNNHAYPEYNATYWATPMTLPVGTVVTIRGQYPRARYMSLQVYDSNRNVVSAINDTQVNPDAGQNNPYSSGTAQGTYTVRLVFGRKPLVNVPANTLYTGGLTTVELMYRIYYSDNPQDLAGGPVDPVLPNIIVNGQTWTSCPVRPILPEQETLSGRLDDIDYVGMPPPDKPSTAQSPTWQFWVTNGVTPYYPSQDNSYMSALVSRDYLQPPYSFDMVVIRMKTPTFPDTQAGVPPYAPANVRFWSMCQDEPITTSVVRCVPDNKAATLNGFATFVISDPSKRPADAVLQRWGASWIPWGALLPTDVIDDIDGNQLTIADGVFYYGLILYRQTRANPAFAQSIENVAKVSPRLRQQAMGDYWPKLGYCSAADFEAGGAACIRSTRAF